MSNISSRYESKNEPHWKKKNLLGNFLLRLVGLGFCIAAVYFLISSFIYKMIQNHQIMTVMIGYLLLVALFCVVGCGSYYVFNNAKENYRKYKILGGKNYEKTPEEVKIPFTEEYQNHSVFPFQKSESTDSRANFKPTNYQILRDLDLVNAILDFHSSQNDSSQNNVLKAFREVELFVKLAGRGDFFNNPDIKSVSLNVIHSLVRMTNQKIFLFSNSKKFSKYFSNLDGSLQIFRREVINRRVFKSIFFLANSDSSDNYNFLSVEGKIVDGHYKLCMQDTLNTEDSIESKNRWKSLFFESLMDKKPELIEDISRGVGKTSNNESVILSVQSVLEDYFKSLGCVDQMNTTNLDFGGSSVEDNSQFSNYKIFVYERISSMFIIQRQAVVEDFFLNQFSNKSRINESSALMDVLKRNILDLRKNSTVFEFQKSFLVATKNINPESIVYKNALSKYDAQVFKYYGEEIERLYKEIISTHNNWKDEKIDELFSEEGFISTSLKSINYALSIIVLTEQSVPLTVTNQSLSSLST